MRGLYVIALLAACSFEPNVLGGDAGSGSGSGSDAPLPVVCPVAYDIKTLGHSYRATSEDGYADTKLDCESDGGHLIKVDDAAENAELRRQIDEANPLPFALEVWIGLDDRDDNNTYLWFDMTAPTFENFSGTPSAGGCVAIDEFDGEWRARECDGDRVAVCECDGP